MHPNELQERWSGLVAACFTAFTFEDLLPGEMFIELPQPMESSKDLGFKRVFSIFIKMLEGEQGGSTGHLPNAVHLDGGWHHFKDATLVVKVKP